MRRHFPEVAQVLLSETNVDNLIDAIAIPDGVVQGKVTTLWF